ncbi:MAG: tripartite tricarboxylate transporter family receptor [Hyphomicrobiales bacterium]|jgi:tripartite-type tricarboxylate transporter receptor subunit TctC|nr:tripartite tricarboxylate transporter family receptor [Hyphomicrobiales bacterium]
MRIFSRRALPFVFLGVASAAIQAGPAAADPVADFYKGKTVSFIVGFAPGGGYDLYARTLAQHMARYIPGSPAVVVQNMTGAGSVRAANHVYVNAPKDGTVIAAVNQNMPMYQLLGGKSAQFDAAKLAWLGSMGGSNGLLYTWHTSRTKTIEDAKKHEVLLGGTGTNSDSHIFPTLINNLLKTRFKVINGYSGGSKEVHLALERGEVEGRGGNAWASLKSSNQKWLDEKKITLLVQIGLEPEPELPDVPLLLDLVKSPADKQIVELVSLPTFVGYAHWVSPEVPADRLAALRRAYAATLKDAAFLADAKKLDMMLRPQTGEQLTATVQRVASTPKDVLQQAARVLEWTE